MIHTLIVRHLTKLRILQICKLLSMNSSAAKVGEIFTEAGAAFNKLAEMTMTLHPLGEQSTNAHAKTPTKRKATDERISTLSGPIINQNPGHTKQSVGMQHVTLNMLNAQENEMDVDDMGRDVKLEFESSTEEVVT